MSNFASNREEGTVPGVAGMALQQLGLEAAELASLVTQGSVVYERRRAGRVTVYKLRYRHQGRLRNRYLGTEPSLAEQVRVELNQLQSEKRQERHLKHVVRLSRHTLRESKSRLQPLLSEAGFRFHGLQIRRQRSHVNGN